MEDYRGDIQEYQQLHDESVALEGKIADSRVADLVRLLKRTGKMKGELPGITPAQFEKLTGHSASGASIRKAQGMTTEQVPWELAFDTIATERGFASGDDIREAIMDTHEDMERLEDLRHSKMLLGERLEAAGQSSEKLKVETEKISGEPPVFGNDDTITDRTTVDGLTIVRRRQYPFWQVEVDTDGQPPPEHKFRIRYSKDSKKLIREMAKAHSEEVESDIQSFRPITRKRRMAKPARLK